MLVNGSKINNFPVLSLHIGGPMAWTKEPIIDPNNLKILGYYVDGALVNDDTGNILETKAIREFSSLGMVVDSSDDLTHAGDVVKLDKILELNFNLIGLKVFTRKGTKLGKVSDYVFTSDNFQIIQLIVQRPAMKSILDPELVIPRSEIVEIDDERIVVKDEKDKIAQKMMTEEFVPNFVNPFRKPDFAKAGNQSPDGQDN